MQYSNLGYGILDHLVSAVSGQPFADFLRREIFLPLGMTRSSLGIAQGIAPYAATRYGADGVAYPFYDFDHPGGSAVFASAHDLVRFAMLHLDTLSADQRRLLKATSLDEMHEPSERTTPTGRYGIGWAVNNDEAGYLTTGHSGGMGGVSTIMTLVPSERIVVVALCNASTALPF